MGAASATSRACSSPVWNLHVSGIPATVSGSTPSAMAILVQKLQQSLSDGSRDTHETLPTSGVDAESASRTLLPAPGGPVTTVIAWPEAAASSRFSRSRRTQ